MFSTQDITKEYRKIFQTHGKEGIQIFVCSCVDHDMLKFTLEQANEGPEEDYCCTRPLTSVLGGGGWSMPCSGCFVHEKDPVRIV